MRCVLAEAHVADSSVTISHDVFIFQAMVHFNKQLAINRDLREDIDHLRRERAVFENLYKKLAKELETCKKEMTDVIEASTQAFEQR